MQTNILSTQSTSGTNGTNAVPRKESANSASHNDAGQFSAMLSSEMTQRQRPMPAPAPAPSAPKPEAPKPQATDKPAQPDEARAPREAAQPSETQAKAADKNQAADGDQDASEDSADAAQADAAAKPDPAAEMLALMASLKNPAQDAATTKGAKGAASQAFDALGGGGKARRGDAQLAALQAAMKSVSKDGATEAGGKTFNAAAVTNPALAAAGADLGTDTKQAAATDTGADLRNMLAAMGKPETKPQLDAADLALQQAREAALQATTQANALPAAAALAQAQPAVLEAQAAAAADMLTAHVGTDQWENQVGQKIVYMVGSEEQTANLTLNPPDLGPMQVVLSITNDQASVTFSSNQLEVRQALENALPRLREMMSESGIALGNASVNAGMPDGRQAQDQPARSGRGFGRSSGRGDDGAVGGVAETAARPARTAILGDRGMVDTFA